MIEEIFLVRKYLVELNSALSSHIITQGGIGTYHTLWVGWEKPNNSTTGMASGGGVLSDCNGEWVRGFSIKLEACPALEAELWAILYGLRLARDKGIRFLIVEVDSLLCRWLNENRKDTNRYRNLREECNHLLRLPQQVEVKHIFREMNQATDLLANLAMDLPCRQLQAGTTPQ